MPVNKRGSVFGTDSVIKEKKRGECLVAYSFGRSAEAVQTSPAERQRSFTLVAHRTTVQDDVWIAGELFGRRITRITADQDT